MLNQEFGDLTVEKLAGHGPRGKSWWCKCKCGNLIRVPTCALISGDQRTCGCGFTKSEKRQPIPTELRQKYRITVKSWEGMLVRCHYVKNRVNAYKGIEICDEWFSFENFLRDMGERPSIDYSIDRIDPTKGYYKENCQWLLKVENSAKIRRNLTPERNKRVSDGVRKAHADGTIVLTDEGRQRISDGALKRVGRKLQSCQKCGLPSYTETCQRCRGKRKKLETP